MEFETMTLIGILALIVLFNYLSVFAAMSTLRWIDHRQKKAIAEIFMREVGEKLQTEATFQDIVNNLNLPTEKDEKED